MQTPNLSPPPTPIILSGHCKFLFYVCEYTSIWERHSFKPFIKIPCISDTVYLSFSDLTWFLGSSTLQQMALVYFLWLNNIPLCTYTILIFFFLGCFPVLAIINSAAMKIGVYVSF